MPFTLVVSRQFRRGLPFQENPATGDARISGTCASLAGLEKALKEETEQEVELAIRRILLMHGIILTIGGIPLIYLGDEIGALNDYSFRNDPDKANDSRWVHRPFMDWEKAGRREDPRSVEGRIFNGLKRLIELRKGHPEFSGTQAAVIPTDNLHILGYVRTRGLERALVFANFSESQQTLPANLLRLYGLSYKFIDLISGKTIPLQDLTLDPYQFVCLKS